MDIKIDAAQIDEYVRDALIKSSIGSYVTKAITNAFGGYNNPIDEGVKRAIAEVVERLLKTEFAPQIEAAVRARIEQAVTGDLISNLAAEATTKILSARY